MKKYIFFLILFISNVLRGQFIDGYTLENHIKFQNDYPIIFYNLLKYDQDLYIGSNNGVFKIDGVSLTKYSETKGHIELLDNSGSKITFKRISKTPNIIKLKAPYIESNIYDKISSIEVDANYLYLIYKNALLVYKKDIFKKSYEGKSIGSISNNFIGTYVGIFDSKNQLLDSFPSYTNSYVREFEDEVFVNFDGLFRYKANKISYFRDNLDGSCEILNTNIGFAKDVYKISFSSYLIFTDKGLYHTDFINQIRMIDSVTSPKEKLHPKYINHYKLENKIVYYIDGKIKAINSELDKTVIIHNFSNNIFDVAYLKDKIYFVDNEGVGHLNHDKIYRHHKSNDYHTIFPVNEDYLALQSNNGLYKLDIKNKKLSSLIDDEFNTKALNVTNDSLYAGGVSGLYKIAINDFINYKPSKIKTTDNTPNYLYLLIFVLFSIILSLAYQLKTRDTIVKPKQKELDIVTNYIIDNLSIITVKNLQDHFGFSYRRLNKVTGEISPGKLIENLRRKKIEELRKQNKSLEVISSETGYKLEYLKKLT